MRLEQLLTILVDNAIKYSARGTVTVSALRQNRQLVIKVEDEGIGIDTQDIERILKDFTGSIKQGRVLKAVLA